MAPPASSLYLDIMLEHIGGASALPFISSLTLEAMQLFGGYHLTIPALMALIGMVIGGTLNWAVGRGLGLFDHVIPAFQNDTYPKICRWMGRYGFVLAALNPAPLGELVLLACGVLRTPLWKTLLALTAGSAVALHRYVL
jgi:membrane protein YqaA with SNARE-associated domain